MPRFTWGGFTDGRPGSSRLAAITVVEADRYVIEGGYVTFILDEEAILSVPDREIKMISKLDDDNNPVWSVEDPPKGAR